MTDQVSRDQLDWEDDDDDFASNPAVENTISTVIEKNLSRRGLFKGFAGAAAVGAFAASGATLISREAQAAAQSTLKFKELAHGMPLDSAVAEGYQKQVLIRWGDPVEKGAPAFDPLHQSAAAQAKQWGYNNDFIGFQPFPYGSGNADHGLLCVNFEYTNHQLMFPGLKKGEIDKQSKEQAEIEMAAHGHGIIEIKRNDQGQWSVVKDSPFNRRISTLLTDFELTGPVAGHKRLQTKADPSGRVVRGTLNNCAGGKTPWGTVLIAEENFHTYFGGDPAKTDEARNYKRYGLKGKPRYSWDRFHDRFNVEKEPNEPNRFGWMVEIDPFDPTSTPKKRTALGRFKHEGANVTINKDGRVVAYMGDDQRFDYVYKFISKGKFDANNREANVGILDEGTLYVAKFEADGKLHWLPLEFGKGPLTAANDFHSQADVLIETRRAADLLGATPMDRPEDVEPNPVTGVVYVALTKNKKRKGGQENVVNPRAENKYGHVLEMIPPGSNGDRDHTAAVFTWDLFLLAGDPMKPGTGAKYHPGTTENGWLACPDNVAFDSRGHIWIATDGAPSAGTADGLWGADVEGEGRALTRHFYHTPLGAELCGPEFNPDDTAFFAAIQHPGDTKGSTFDAPSTRYPDFKDSLPPRPSLEVITKIGGGRIGS